MPTRAPHRHVDYTDMAHHEDVPDSRDTGDPSRPQGWFWYQNERFAEREIENVDLGQPGTRRPGSGRDRDDSGS